MQNMAPMQYSRYPRSDLTARRDRDRRFGADQTPATFIRSIRTEPTVLAP